MLYQFQSLVFRVGREAVTLSSRCRPDFGGPARQTGKERRWYWELQRSVTVTVTWRVVDAGHGAQPCSRASTRAEVTAEERRAARRWGVAGSRLFAQSSRAPKQQRR
ncbi:hypothetical protein PMIN06_004665 [Paraphaeosphaeria minitans]